MPVKRHMVKTHHADIAYSETAGQDLPVVLIHGNSSNRKVFDAQMESEAGAKHRLIAIDLPGHGDSSDAFDPETSYTMKGYADAVVEALGVMGVDRAAVYGWSLGGHVGIEMIARYPGMVGLMMTGTPPVGRSPEAIQAGFQPSPHAGLAGKPEFTPEEAAIFAFATYGDPQSPAAHEAFARTDGRARAVMLGSLFSGGASDQRRIAESTTVPLAMVNGEKDPLVNNDYIGSLSYRNLWEKHCFVLREAGHAPFMQAPDVFNPIFARFADDMAQRAETMPMAAGSAASVA